MACGNPLDSKFEMLINISGFERRLELNLDDSSIDLYSSMKGASFAIESQDQIIKMIL
jgi:hypothetical protein